MRRDSNICFQEFVIYYFAFTMKYVQGGIKAVMWTDTFQGAVMFGSFLAVIIKGNFDACGAKVVWDRNYQSGRIEFFK